MLFELSSVSEQFLYNSFKKFRIDFECPAKCCTLSNEIFLLFETENKPRCWPQMEFKVPTKQTISLNKK